MKRVIAYHLIITAYGFWLPNEPRGSWSDVVRSFDLARFGPATKVDTTRSVAHRPYNRALKREMENALVRKPVEFDGMQARAIARGFHDYCDRTDCVIHAGCILPRHAHLVIARRQNVSIEQTARLLKASATSQLVNEGLHPFPDGFYRDGRRVPIWTRHAWAPFLWDEKDICRAIDYVNNNPIRERKRPQLWKFVTPFVIQ